MFRAVPASEGCMISPAPSSAPAHRAIRVWLLVVAALMVVTVVVGGATRLTEFGSVDRRMEAGHRRPAAARCERLAGRVRQVQGHPAIPRTQCGDEPCGLQDDLLVGVDASRAGPPGRRRVPASAALVPVARPGRTAPARAAVDHFLPRRRAGCGRVVDGRIRAQRPRQRVAISAGVPLDAGLRHLCRRPLDRAEPFRRARRSPRRRASAGARWRCSVS